MLVGKPLWVQCTNASDWYEHEAGIAGLIRVSMPDVRFALDLWCASGDTRIPATCSLAMPETIQVVVRGDPHTSRFPSEWHAVEDSLLAWEIIPKIVVRSCSSRVYEVVMHFFMEGRLLPHIYNLGKLDILYWEIPFGGPFPVPCPTVRDVLSISASQEIDGDTIELVYWWQRTLLWALRDADEKKEHERAVALHQSRLPSAAKKKPSVPVRRGVSVSPAPSAIGVER